MNFDYIKLCSLVLIVSTCIIGCGDEAAKNVLGQKALVKHFYTVNGIFCNFENRIVGPNEQVQRDDELEELHLEKNKSKFRLKNRATEEVSLPTGKAQPKPIDFLNVEPSSQSPIQLPDMRIFNDEKLASATGGSSVDDGVLKVDYCKSGGKISEHVYAFGIHDLKDPHTNKTNPHAFIYIPMNWGGTAQPGFGNAYYLFLLSIENDSPRCKEGAGDYLRCKALRELALLQMDGVKGKDFRIAVQANIEKILPPVTPYDPVGVRYHNGVIHGGF